VRTAALLLTAMAGSDPADAATAEADANRSDYAAALKPDALKGVRIGVMRWAAGWSAPVDALFEAALATLTAQGAVLVDVAAPTGAEGVGAGEYKVLVTELKAGLNAYLATTPAAVKTRTLADVIAFNKATGRELALFGQEHFIVAEATKGLADSEYKTARAISLKQSTDALAGMIAAGKVAALVSPTAAPAWFIDAMVGDRSSGGRNAGTFAAVAGWPHLTVPMGAVKGLPVGLSFIGPRWSEAQLLAFGHVYEQASRKRVTPTFAASVEAMPALAPAFAPPAK
jgi:amidase